MRIWEIALIFFVVLGIGFYIFTAPEDDERTQSIYVYGTLTNPLFRAYACYCLTDFVPETLPGYEKDGLTVEPNESSEVAGGVIRVTQQELERIDAYEEYPQKYRREKITLNQREHWIYIKNEE